ncbi:MAG: hypothetical protein AEth_01324 [Candidatus Argoarchaeum ethanivorans]|uniref:Uncharacterized protein n=1 Tax=Candidatus Argoarchaeum ethanivorans TaxID=2608793 RepID=A0A8B3S274_9EURY|nr:MAG: hypothetical protein AEth_01324 [Candidatus Argoarchaeum ethanivorans]
MVILNNSLLQNGTILLTNGSLNLTLDVIAENLTGKLVSDSSVLSKFFPIITLIIGALLTYFLNIFQIQKRENKERCRYEYTLITDILDISKEENKQDKMVKYYDKEKRNPDFRKIENYKLIVEFMKDVLDGKTVDKKDLERIQTDLIKKI